MILLISSLDKTEDLAQALQETTSQGVQVCTGFTLAIAHLQAREFSAVVLDQLLLDADPGGSETACKHFGSAVPVYVNFAIHGSARVVRELRSALARRQREMLAARMDAQHALRHELSGTITALLLSCQLALRVPGLPASAEAKMQTVDALAKEISTKMGAMA